MKNIAYGALAALVLSPAAFADSGKGQAFYEPTVRESVELADGRVLSRVSVSGFVIGSTMDNPFHMVNQHCSGTEITTAGEAMPTSFGSCEGMDRDGDIFFISYSGPTWQILGGTGKFDGLTGGGTTAITHAWPDGKYVIDWEGTWKMK